MRLPRAIVVLLTAATLCVALAPAASASADDASRAVAGDVRIDEVSSGGPAGATDSFIELRNTASHAVALAGWSVFRCDGEGLRAAPTAPDARLDGLVLRPGERLTLGRSVPGGAVGALPRPLNPQGFGVVLLSPEGEVADSFAAYSSDPVPLDGDCGLPDAPAALAWALDESWQRTDEGDWVRAPATPGGRNAQAASEPTGAVRIEEIAAAGPAGHGDDIVELRNTTASAVDLSGWRVLRCTADGRATADTVQHVFGRGSALQPGARFTLGGPETASRVDARMGTSLADAGSGVLLVDQDGRRIDAVAVSTQRDSACQQGTRKLTDLPDYRSGESWQRTDTGAWVLAPRTPGAPNAQERRIVGASAPAAESAVRISELATDPEIDRPGVTRHAFVELANEGDVVVDVSGWRLIACTADGYRAFGTLATLASGTRLDPGAAWTAALRGTADAASAQAVFDTPFELRGAGVWLEDAAGRRVDSVGVYHRNEMDASVDTDSPCTQGLALSTFGVDRLRGQTYQRISSTGDNARDFVAAAATPGEAVARTPVTTDELLAEALDRAEGDVPAALRAEAAAAPVVGSPAAAGTPARVVAAWAGTASGPLAVHVGGQETAAAVVAPAARDDGYDWPYVRFVAELGGSDEVAWSGRTVGRAAVRLSVWDPDAGAWRELDTRAGGATASSDSAESPVTLSGRLRAGERLGGRAELLVQVVPADAAPLLRASGMGDPADYDLAITHFTDTQYYTEAYPDVYATEVGWILANAQPRKIAFVTHTGDLVQNWVDPDQPPQRAHREYETASAFQAALDDAGIANSVLPGNHDSKRGNDETLFNAFFGPSRYAGRPWYGGSFAPDDNSANWSMIEAGGSRWLMLSLPYAYGEAQIAWADRIVEQHPDANVVISTHEHLSPRLADDPAERSSSRWVSRAQELWDRVIAPHRNVVLVLSGHFHGLGAIVTRNAGGVPGHTVVEALADYQEFRTHTGERATGFLRLLQVDLAAGMLAVDAYSPVLDAAESYPYDYEQFLPDDGTTTVASNERPWNLLDAGLQRRYTAADDAYAVPLELQHAKAVETDAITVPPATLGR